jgi:hypothetical protein
MGPSAIASNEISEPAIPNDPTICAASEAAERDRDAGLDLGARAREALLRVAVREQTQRAAALDDRQHLEAAALAHEVGDGGVSGLVDRDGGAIALRVDDGLLDPDLIGELCLVDVVEVHLAPAVAKRDEDRLVEEVLDHHRRVSEGVVREPLARLLAVERPGRMRAGSSWSARFVAAISRMLL